MDEASLTAGRLTCRLETKIPEGLDAAIRTKAKELAGGGDPTMFRSKAVRALLVAGVLAEAQGAPARTRARR